MILKPNLLVPILLFGISACSGSQNPENNNQIDAEIIDNPKSAKEETSESENKKPEFQFENEQHDFGTVKQGEEVSYAFKFKNEGNKALVISDASASCGCTVPHYPKKPVKTGASGTIEVVFDSEGKSGKFNKSVTLLANTQPKKKKLNIKGEIKKSN